MTNEDMLDDLKQFIDARFAQQDAELDRELNEELDAKLDEKLAPIHQKIDDLAASVAETFDAINNDNDRRFDDHEQRIVRLEKRAA